MGNCQQCIIKEISNLKSLSSLELKRISEYKGEVFFKKGDVIFKEGYLLNGVYCVKKGKCKLTKLSPNGKEQIVKFIKDGDMLGYRSVLGDEHLSLSAVALEDMSACFIPKQNILEVLRQNKNFSKDLFKVVCHDLKEANASIASIAQKTVRERLAETILFLNETFGEDGDGCIDLVLSRVELSSVVGTATESAIRLLSELSKDQVISLIGRRIKIKDAAALRRIGSGF
jgi:CRP-like cAMP-binding protein